MRPVLTLYYFSIEVTPAFGLLSSILCIMVLHEPERGVVEIKALHGDDRTHSHGLKEKKSKYTHDLKYLFKV